MLISTLITGFMKLHHDIWPGKSTLIIEWVNELFKGNKVRHQLVKRMGTPEMAKIGQNTRPCLIQYEN